MRESGFVSSMYDDGNFLIGIERCCRTYQACIIKRILLLECMHLGFGRSPFDSPSPWMPLNFIGCITDKLQQDYFL